MPNSPRIEKKLRREMAVFGNSCSFAAISSVFHIVHAYESHHTKGGEPLNNL